MFALETPGGHAHDGHSLTVADILPNDLFEAARPRLRPLLQELRRVRRRRIGPHCSILFENRETVRWQIQEVLRVEHRSEPHQVVEELVRYSPLLSAPGELRATVLIDGGPPEDADRLCMSLARDPATLQLRVGDCRCVAECVDQTPELPSPVRYMCFRLADRGVRADDLLTRPVDLVLRDSCTHIEQLPPAVCRALVTDLTHC